MMVVQVLVQPYTRTASGQVVRGEAYEVRSAAEARREAYYLTSTGAGAVAFYRFKEKPRGEFGPTVVFASYRTLS